VVAGLAVVLAAGATAAASVVSAAVAEPQPVRAATLRYEATAPADVAPLVAFARVGPFTFKGSCFTDLGFNGTTLVVNSATDAIAEGSGTVSDNDGTPTTFAVATSLPAGVDTTVLQPETGQGFTQRQVSTFYLRTPASAIHATRVVQVTLEASVVSVSGGTGSPCRVYGSASALR
jgi:hypothetical protein